MGDVGSGYSFAKLKEELVNEELPALRMAGLVSDEVAEYLLSMERHWEPGEEAYYAFNSDEYEYTLRREVTKNLRQAVINENQAVIEHAIGLADGADKVRLDFVDFYELKDILETPAFMLNIFASPRTGKTFTAARLCDLWLMFHPGGIVISNIRSWTELCPDGRYEKRMPDAIRRAEEHTGPVLLMMDELSSEGAYKDLQKSGVEAGLRSFFRKMGKQPYECSYIGIGHRVVEIAPMLRSGEMAYFGFKQGKSKEEARKHLVIYEDQDKEEKVVDLHGIGLPEYSPDTDDPAELEWGTPEEYIELGHMKPEDVDDEGEEVNDGQCPAETNAGKPCPGSPKEKWDGYCYNHRHLASGDETDGE